MSTVSAESEVYKCSECGVIKPNSEFYKNNKATGNYRKYTYNCKVCRAKYIKDRYSKDKKKERYIRDRKKHRLRMVYRFSVDNAKRKGTEHSISFDYIKELWRKQEGMCFYTGKPMLDNMTDINNSEDSVSIDRINSTMGYVEGNVALCRWIVNRMKNNLTVSQMIDILEDIKTNSCLQYAM